MIFFALQIEISRHRVTKRLAVFTHLNKKPKKGNMGRLTTETNLLTSPLPSYISFKLVASPPHTYQREKGNFAWRVRERGMGNFGI